MLDFSKENILRAVPWLTLLIGTSFFIWGTYGDFEDLSNKEFVSGLGKTILAGGIFALLLKTIQFMGVFKTELSKVVYDPKFLSNRRDLPEVWEGVSKELFKNKFPGISKRLLKDITEKYLPTDHSIYYDDVEHYFNIKHLEGGVVEVNYVVTMNIICSSSKDNTYAFSNSVGFKESKDEIYLEFEVKIDDEKVDVEPKELTKGNLLVYTYSIPLCGNKDKYKVERNEVKRYLLDSDNMMYFRAAKIINNLKVEIHHPQDLIVDFRKCGTLGEFEIKRNTENYKQFKYSGIAYPQQGYLFTLNKST